MFEPEANALQVAEAEADFRSEKTVPTTARKR
jgi:hypothetical protein